MLLIRRRFCAAKTPPNTHSRLVGGVRHILAIERRGGANALRSVLYAVNMARARHPKKDVEAALAEAEAAGWRVTPSSAGHRWGVMRCQAEGRGCQGSIWSTPRSSVGHARQLRRLIRRCPHGREVAGKED